MAIAALHFHTCIVKKNDQKKNKKKNKKDLATSPLSSYSFPVNHSQLMNERLENLRQSIRQQLTAGVKTNFGTFTHFDADGTAHFIQANGQPGWTGANALHFVQVR